MEGKLDDDVVDFHDELSKNLVWLKNFESSKGSNPAERLANFSMCCSQIASALLKISDLMKDNSQDKAFASLSAFAKAVEKEILNISKKKPSDREIDEAVSGRLVPVINSLCQLAALHPSEKFSWTNNVSKVFEKWFIHGFPDHKPSQKFCVLYLLTQLVKLKKPTKTLVTRASQVQKAIKAEDLDDKYMKKLLIQISQSKIVTKSKQGIRFLVFLFTLREDFVIDLHNALKEVIPGISKPQAQAYGKVYYKAWLLSSGHHRTAIAENCIQNFMQHAVGANRNVSSSQQIFWPVLTILNRFHKNKNSKETQAAMVELWRPILRFHLFAPNSHVRLNACDCFFSAFPLENPFDDPTQKVQEEATQIEYMLELLDDSVPEVRTAAVKGVCRILAKYWRIISIAHINRLFKDLIEECSCDGSSHHVRKSVLEGMAHLVRKCPYSRKYLQDALPLLSGLLFDQNENVRQAMVDLLLTIRGVKEIKFWEISSMDDLLYQLSSEKNPKICKSIVELLKSSYFPEDQNTTTKLERCIHLIQSNRQASRKFYQYLPLNTTVISAVGFILETLVNIKRYFQYMENESENSQIFQVGTKRILDEKVPVYGSPKRRALSNLNSLARNIGGKTQFELANSSFQSDSSICSKSQSDTYSSSILEKRELLGMSSFKEKFEEQDTLVGLFDALCFFSIGLYQELFKDENAEFRKLLHTKAAGCLRKIFPFLKSHDAFHPMLYMSSLLKKSLVRNIESHCWSRLMNDRFLPNFSLATKPWNEIDVGLFDESNTTPLMVDALCNWGRTKELMETLEEWLSKEISSNSAPVIQPTRAVRFAESKPNVELEKRAVCILDVMLNRHITKSIIIEKHLESLEKLGDVLEKIYLPKILLNVKATDSSEDDFHQFSFELLLKIRTIIFEETEKSARDKSLAKLLDQLDKIFDWHLNSKNIEESFSLSKISQGISLDLIMFASRLIALNVINESFLEKLTNIISRLLHNVSDVVVLKSSIGFAQNVCDSNKFEEHSICQLLNAIISGISGCNERNIETFQKVLKAIKNLVSKGTSKLKPQHGRVLCCILDEIVKDLASEILQVESYQAMSTDWAFPPVSSLWLEVVTHKEELLQSFVLNWRKVLHLRNTTKADIGAQILLLKKVTGRCKLNASLSDTLDEIYNELEKSFFELDDPELDNDENSFVVFVNNALDETQADLSRVC